MGRSADNKIQLYGSSAAGCVVWYRVDFRGGDKYSPVYERLFDEHLVHSNIPAAPESFRILRHKTRHTTHNRQTQQQRQQQQQLISIVASTLPTLCLALRRSEATALEQP